MHYRKNINCLSADELHDLREALAAMYALPAADPNSFATLASFHGGPPITYCAHGAPGFFTWHRAYLMAFENALRHVGCHVTLPYWNWSSGPTTGVPAACREATYVNRAGATVANPLYSGPRPGGGQTSRRATIDTTAFDDLATSAQAAMTEADFGSFQSQMNGVHGGVHVRTGGDMGGVPSAAYDPIFYLHHANIDRLWADWQAAHPAVALPAAEASFQLQPFPRPFSTQWQTGADVQSTVTLGYRYRRFCFRFPPFRVWEVVAIEWPFRDPIGPLSVRVLLKAHHMQPEPVEIRAFLDQPDAGPGTPTIGNPSFAGVGAFFGHGSPDPHGEKPKASAAGGHGGHGETARPALQPGVKERFDIELNITAALRARKPQDGKVVLKLVAVDGNGREVPADKLIVDDVSVEVE